MIASTCEIVPFHNFPLVEMFNSLHLTVFYLLKFSSTRCRFSLYENVFLSVYVRDSESLSLLYSYTQLD